MATAGLPYGLQAMLKEGHRHYSGLEGAVYRNIEACKALASIVKTSMGPNGESCERGEGKGGGWRVWQQASCVAARAPLRRKRAPVLPHASRSASPPSFVDLSAVL